MSQLEDFGHLAFADIEDSGSGVEGLECMLQALRMVTAQGKNFRLQDCVPTDPQMPLFPKTKLLEVQGTLKICQEHQALGLNLTVVVPMLDLGFRASCSAYHRRHHQHHHDHPRHHHHRHHQCDSSSSSSSSSRCSSRSS